MPGERRVTAAALVVAPALFLLSNLLHPKEFAVDHEAAQLAKIGEAYGRWQAAHAVTFVSMLVFALASVGLALLVARRDRRTGVAGGALAIVGLIGLGGVLAIDGFAWGIAGEVWARSDDAGKRTAELVLSDLQHSEWGLMFYVTPLAWIVGMLVLALAAVRTGLVPAWAGGLFALGSLLVGLEAAIKSNVYFVIASCVLLAGGAAVAAAIAKPAAPAA